MLDIRGEFSKVEAEFVSVCRLVERLQIISRHESPSGEVSVPEVCTWLIKKTLEDFFPQLKVLTKFFTIEKALPNGSAEDEAQWLRQKLNTIINHKHLPIKNDEDLDIDDWFDQSLYNTGFLLTEIESFFPDLVKKIEFTFYETPSQLNIVSMESKYTSIPDLNSLDSDDIPEQPCVWDNFKGKDTALMMIAGLAISLSKSGASYKRSDEINVSAIARAAANAINQYGTGVDVTNRALENLVREALNQHTSKSVS